MNIWMGITLWQMNSFVDLCLRLQIAWSKLESTEDFPTLKKLRF